MAITSHNAPVSLSRRLTVSLSMLAVGLFIIMFGVTWTIVDRYAAKNLREDLLARATSIIALSEQERGDIEIDFNEKFMPDYAKATEPHYLQIWSWNGRADATLAHSRSLKENNLPLPKALTTVPSFYAATIDGRHVTVMAMRFTPVPEQHGSADTVEAVIAVASGMEATARFKQTFLLLSLIPLLVFFAAMLVGIHGFIRKGLQPLHRLVEAVTKIDINNLHASIDVDNPPLEVRPLVEQLNTLFMRLQKAMENERRFSSDVAHELRTPIAEIKLICEVEVRRGEKSSAYSEILAAAADMEATVETLLTIARIEGNKEAVVHEVCDVNAIIHALQRRYESQQKKRNIIFEYVDVEPLLVRSDCRKLELVLGNLMSNTITHALEGSTCTMRVAQDRDDTMSFHISNPAPQLGEGDQEKLFERFWQKEASRTKRGHSGLGLSLVKSLCGYLGLAIAAELSKDRLLTLTVSGLKKV